MGSNCHSCLSRPRPQLVKGLRVTWASLGGHELDAVIDDRKRKDLNIECKQFTRHWDFAFDFTKFDLIPIEEYRNSKLTLSASYRADRCLLSSGANIWRLLRREDGDSAELRVGSSIVLGGIRLRVKQITLQKNDLRESRSESVPCKFCLEEEETRLNPLISVCSCRGSLSKTHLNCLNALLLSDHAKLTCRLCKDEIQTEHDLGSLKLQLESRTSSHSIKTIEPPYLVLDYANEQKTITVQLVDQGKVSIGRGDSSDTVVKDASVSKTHCSLRLVGNKVLIEDEGSTFGTLFFCGHQFTLGRGQKASLKVGSQFIALQLDACQ